MTATDHTGLVFNIQRHSTEDGPGIRTSLFLKGCVMSCPWCHNPEGRSTVAELAWHRTRCTGAGHCVAACPHGALELAEDGIGIDRARCDTCGACIDVCPSNALEVMGREYDVDELVQRAMQDKAFYDASGGGVTLSGGEASIQVDFLVDVMERLRDHGVHVALDTCGGTSWRQLGPLVELADLVLYDLKLIDAAGHKEHTGISLERVLDNARRVAASGTPMWIRTPIIPGYTDGDENVRGIARFIRTELPTVERYDLLAFNHTCELKYERIGMPWTLSGVDLVAEPKMERLAAIARAEGLDGVHWSGLTAPGTATEVSLTPSEVSFTPVSHPG